VKLLDHSLAQRLRQLSPSQLKNKISNILRETPKVKDIKVAAAHQLKSGDAAIITYSLDEATELQTHTDWARGLGPRAEVIKTTYGAIVHGIPVNSINVSICLYPEKSRQPSGHYMPLLACRGVS
jgi:hypothetical protein